MKPRTFNGTLSFIGGLGLIAGATIASLIIIMAHLMADVGIR